MRIVEIRETTVPLGAAIGNASIDFRQMTTSAVALITDVKRDGRPIVGFGFGGIGRYGQGEIIRTRLVPRLMSAPPGELLTADGSNLAPERLWAIMMRNEKPGGHGDRAHAVGAIDMAVWDATAKIAGMPLNYLLARHRGGTPAGRVFVYAAGGYYGTDKGVDGLRAEMLRYLDAGFGVLKMKIAGAPLAEDLNRIEAVLSLVGGDGSRLAVDANGRLERGAAHAYAEALSPYKLRWFEEPGDPLDFALHAELGSHYAGPMATGENLFSFQDARNLVRYAAMRPDRDLIQVDPVLAGGLVEYLRIVECLAANGWSARALQPHGGHLFALHVADGLGLSGSEAYPGVFQPFGGFGDDMSVEDGSIALGERPGIGFEAKSALHAVLRALIE